MLPCGARVIGSDETGIGLVAEVIRDTANSRTGTCRLPNVKAGIAIPAKVILPAKNVVQADGGDSALADFRGRA
jgi:hypothetical protein